MSGMWRMWKVFACGKTVENCRKLLEHFKGNLLVLFEFPSLGYEWLLHSASCSEADELRSPVVHKLASSHSIVSQHQPISLQGVLLSLLNLCFASPPDVHKLSQRLKINLI